MDQSTTICQAAEGPPHSLAQPAQLSETLSPTGSTHVSKGRRALFWSMSGTILSAVGFIALALFEQYNGMLAELRGDLKHFNEISSEFVKKDSLQRLRDHIRESLKDLQAACATRVQMEQELRASEHAREEMVREMQQIRERLAYLEGRHAGAASERIWPSKQSDP